jgi:hypothetical protein
MRYERFIPMEYANEALMNELNDFCIALKVWLFPDQFGDKLYDLQRRYPKPEITDIDSIQNRLNNVLKKDCKPLVRY